MDKEEIVRKIAGQTVLPIISAPMFLVSGPDLVTACCKSGVICAFPAPNARTIEQLEQWMKTITEELEAAKVRHQNEPVAPWAANIIAHRSYDRLEQELELIKKYQPPIVITALGSPVRIIDAVHDYGGLVFADVNSIHFAKKAAETGVDGLILVSAGAGGHTGTITGFAFVDAVRQFWDGVIVLAGGISSGKGVLAAQSLGADLVYMGTTFISAEESLANSQYKQMLVESEFDDIISTNAFTGVHANMLKPSIERAGLDVKNLKPKSTIDFSNPQGDKKAWKDIWSAGHGVGQIKDVQPAGRIIERLRGEYRDAYADLTRRMDALTEIKS